MTFNPETDPVKIYLIPRYTLRMETPSGVSLTTTGTRYQIEKWRRSVKTPDAKFTLHENKPSTDQVIACLDNMCDNFDVLRYTVDDLSHFQPPMNEHRIAFCAFSALSIADLIPKCSTDEFHTLIPLVGFLGHLLTTIETPTCAQTVEELDKRMRCQNAIDALSLDADTLLTLVNAIVDANP